MSRRGVFVAVVGPSGAGKDTLLNGAARSLADRADIMFVRRVITREPDGATEDHDTLSPEAFAAAREAGRFCMNWDANGLSYALPIAALGSKVAGQTVVANISRGAIAAASSAFGDVVVVEITASPEVLAHRLRNRGRETSSDIEQRLARSTRFALPTAVIQHVVVDNSGALEDGVHELARAIGRAASMQATAVGDFAR